MGWSVPQQQLTNTLYDSTSGNAKCHTSTGRVPGKNTMVVKAILKALTYLDTKASSNSTPFLKCSKSINSVWILYCSPRAAEQWGACLPHWSPILPLTLHAQCFRYTSFLSIPQNGPFVPQGLCACCSLLLELLCTRSSHFWFPSHHSRLGLKFVSSESPSFSPV